MTELRIKKLSDDVIIPRYATKGSAALDLTYRYAQYCSSNFCAELSDGFSCASESTKQDDGVFKFHTGIACEIPSGYCGLIVPRSGLGCKGFTLVNGTGVIDSDYRGELIVVMKWQQICNSGDAVQFKANNTRIAQLLIVPVLHPEIVEVSSLVDTERGEGGFGSTGLNARFGNRTINID